MGRRRVFSDEERVERMKSAQKKWREKNKKHIEEYRARYVLQRSDRINAYMREYYELHRERILARQKAYYKRRCVDRLKASAAEARVNL
mmetsp:Transcript_2401/g.6192  ORF Transcript_2401/g.6192 Transcript_2401/m.6192 type:complete len:89 (+) Transcript_2401:879-1145(+)